jgi:ribosomal protein S14
MTARALHSCYQSGRPHGFLCTRVSALCLRQGAKEKGLWKGLFKPIAHPVK